MFKWHGTQAKPIASHKVQSARSRDITGFGDMHRKKAPILDLDMTPGSRSSKILWREFCGIEARFNAHRDPPCAFIWEIMLCLSLPLFFFPFRICQVNYPWFAQHHRSLGCLPFLPFLLLQVDCTFVDTTCTLGRIWQCSEYNDAAFQVCFIFYCRGCVHTKTLASAASFEFNEFILCCCCAATMGWLAGCC